jgi:hypothetical protein
MKKKRENLMNLKKKKKFDEERRLKKWKENQNQMIS